MSDGTPKTDGLRYVRMQILISVLTLLLTPVFSGLVVYFQLSVSNDFWQQQQQTIQLRSDAQRQTAMLIRESAMRSDLAVKVHRQFVAAIYKRDAMRVVQYRLYVARIAPTMGVSINTPADLAKDRSREIELHDELQEIKSELTSTLLQIVQMYGGDVSVDAANLMTPVERLRGGINLNDEEKADVVALLKLVKESPSDFFDGTAIYQPLDRYAKRVSNGEMVSGYKDLISRMWDYIRRDMRELGVADRRGHAIDDPAKATIGIGFDPDHAPGPTER